MFSPCGSEQDIPGLEDRTFPYGFSEVSIDAVVESDVCLAIGTELGDEDYHLRRYIALGKAA